jgi:hypothetical protein
MMLWMAPPSVMPRSMHHASTLVTGCGAAASPQTAKQASGARAEALFANGERLSSGRLTHISSAPSPIW